MPMESAGRRGARWSCRRCRRGRCGPGCGCRRSGRPGGFGAGLV